MFNFERKIRKMEAMKFDTQVRENGVLKIPELKNYVNKNVEVFVVIKPENPIISVKTDITEFFEKWAGFFKEIKSDDIKYNYLMEKHK